MSDDTTPASTRRAQCARCLRPASACICTWIRPTPNEVEVLILQHPMEVNQAKGSARLLQLSLARCEVLVGETLDPQVLHASLYRSSMEGRTVTPVLLYPEEAPTPGANAIDYKSSARALRLVVIDGTWRKSLKMLHAHPELRTLPRVSLSAVEPSRYLIRKAPKPGQLSTLEASCLALARLESNLNRYVPLLDAFDGFVAVQRTNMTRLGT